MCPWTFAYSCLILSFVMTTTVTLLNLCKIADLVVTVYHMFIIVILQTSLWLCGDWLAMNPAMVLRRNHSMATVTLCRTWSFRPMVSLHFLVLGTTLSVCGISAGMCSVVCSSQRMSHHSADNPHWWMQASWWCDWWWWHYISVWWYSDLPSCNSEVIESSLYLFSAWIIGYLETLQLL